MTVTLLLALLTASAPKIASPAWNVVDVKPELAAFYAEQLADGLRGEGLQVTTADDIAQILGAERQRQLLGCLGGESCMAELANALGCEATLTVNLARLGGGFRGLAKLMGSSNGKVLSSVRIDARDEAELADKLIAAAKVLASPLKPSTAPVGFVAASTRVAPKWWWLPGAVGVVAGGAGALLFSRAAERLKDLRATSDAALGQSFANEGQAFQVAGWIAASVGGAAVVGSLLWLLLGSSEVQPQVALGPAGAVLGIRGHF